jgi:two-component system response regulator AlgR
MKRLTVKALHLGKPVVWKVADIVRFESQDKYTVAYRNDGKQLLITDSLRTLAVELADSFIQIHRGALVARDALIGVKSHADRMEGVAFVAGVPEPLPCGRRYVSAVKRFIRQRQAETKGE